ncbi:MAG: hypothetical protein Q7J31_08655 [Syntrophales bacterium]|nr:hypothetical protein [Syntrophales bacterium]
MATDHLVNAHPLNRLFHGFLDQAFVDMAPPYLAAARVRRQALGGKHILSDPFVPRFRRRVNGLGSDCLPRPINQTHLRQEAGKVLCPFYIKQRTFWAYPVLLHTRPVGFPKTIALFGISAKDDLYHKIPFHYNKLHNKDPTMIDEIIVS